MTIIESLHTLTASIATVTNAGGKTTKEYDRILTRWNDYANQASTAQQQLTAAILGKETPERIAELNALTLAELANHVDRATVMNAVADEVYPALRNEYAKTAAANYEALAAKFNTTAQTLTEAMQAVDIETAPEHLMSGTDEQRSAWAHAPALAAALTSQVPNLTEAARLAGLTIQGADGTLPLTVNPGALHRRRVWEAWENATGRAGKWGALITLGATIEASDLDEYKHYRRPAPIETRYEQVGRGMHRPVEIDPEDQHHRGGATADQLAPSMNTARTKPFVGDYVGI
ncbi:hypothetical protein [Pseudarthrobacter sp. NS4]|uniref:hypothetical protein n=1 Tax=Pseudarthrobacter sp. NS4 TaxID=2973976 RepID=UPI002162C52A|nr:hypothetical protein [Pseudarthrobacter sp. NS4]